MQFQMPQFIEIEDKIFGPFTLRQFVYLVGSAGISFVLWRVLPIYFAIPLVVVILGFGLALAFYKVNGRPFIFAVQSAAKYFATGKMYLWRRRSESGQSAMAPRPSVPMPPVPAPPSIDRTKIHDLAWSLDVLDRPDVSNS